MRRALLSVACVALVACESTGPRAENPSPTPTSAASPSAHTSPTAVPSLSIAPFSCRLPVITQTSATEKVGGFVTFPAGTYQADPAGGLQAIGGGKIATLAEPKLYGYGDSPFYDLAMKRFIPASPSQTSPDGRTYAYAQNGYVPGGNATVFVVTVATGVQRGLPINIGDVYTDDFDGRYVYLVGPGGVWAMDTSTGQYPQVALSIRVATVFVRGDNFWGGGDGTTEPDTIGVIDTRTGALTTWISLPGQRISILGFDLDGHPVVSVSHAPDFNARFDTVLLLYGPGNDRATISDGGLLLNHEQRDNGRLWFGSDRGIYFWTPSGGLQKVFESTLPIAPAGFCV